MRVYFGLIMLVARVLSPGFLASYWSGGFGTFLQVSALLPMAGGLCRFYANAGI